MTLAQQWVSVNFPEGTTLHSIATAFIRRYIEGSAAMDGLIIGFDETYTGDVLTIRDGSKAQFEDLASEIVRVVAK